MGLSLQLERNQATSLQAPMAATAPTPNGSFTPTFRVVRPEHLDSECKRTNVKLDDPSPRLRPNCSPEPATSPSPSPDPRNMVKILFAPAADAEPDRCESAMDAASAAGTTVDDTMLEEDADFVDNGVPLTAALQQAAVQDAKVGGNDSLGTNMTSVAGGADCGDSSVHSGKAGRGHRGRVRRGGSGGGPNNAENAVDVELEVDAAGMDVREDMTSEKRNTVAMDAAAAATTAKQEANAGGVQRSPPPIQTRKLDRGSDAPARQMSPANMAASGFVKEINATYDGAEEAAIGEQFPGEVVAPPVTRRSRRRSSLDAIDEKKLDLMAELSESADTQRRVEELHKVGGRKEKVRRFSAARIVQKQVRVKIEQTAAKNRRSSVDMVHRYAQRWVAKNKVNYRRRCVNLIQAVARRWLAKRYVAIRRRDYHEEANARLLLQCQARAMAAKRERSRRIFERNREAKASTVLGTAARRKLARKEAERRMGALLVVQCVARRLIARRVVTRRRASINLVHTSFDRAFQAAHRTQKLHVQRRLEVVRQFVEIVLETGQDDYRKTCRQAQAIIDRQCVEVEAAERQRLRLEAEAAAEKVELEALAGEVEERLRLEAEVAAEAEATAQKQAERLRLKAEAEVRRNEASLKITSNFKRFVFKLALRKRRAATKVEVERIRADAEAEARQLRAEAGAAAAELARKNAAATLIARSFKRCVFKLKMRKRAATTKAEAERIRVKAMAEAARLRLEADAEVERIRADAEAKAARVKAGEEEAAERRRLKAEAKEARSLTLAAVAPDENARQEAGAEAARVKAKAQVEAKAEEPKLAAEEAAARVAREAAEAQAERSRLETEAQAAAEAQAKAKIQAGAERQRLAMAANAGELLVTAEAMAANIQKEAVEAEAERLIATEGDAATAVLLRQEIEAEVEAVRVAKEAAEAGAKRLHFEAEAAAVEAEGQSFTERERVATEALEAERLRAEQLEATLVEEEYMRIKEEQIAEEEKVQAARRDEAARLAAASALSAEEKRLRLKAGVAAAAAVEGAAVAEGILAADRDFSEVESSEVAQATASAGNEAMVAGYRGRQVAQERRDAVVTLHRFFKHVVDMLLWRQVISVIMIQARCRQALALRAVKRQRHLMRLESSATRIQCLFRKAGATKEVMRRVRVKRGGENTISLQQSRKTIMQMTQKKTVENSRRHEFQTERIHKEWARRQSMTLTTAQRRKGQDGAEALEGYIMRKADDGCQADFAVDRLLQPFFDQFEDTFCRSPDDDPLEVRRTTRHDSNREVGLSALTAAIAHSEHLMMLAPPPGFTVVNSVSSADESGKIPPTNALLRIIPKSKDHLAMLDGAAYSTAAPPANALLENSFEESEQVLQCDRFGNFRTPMLPEGIYEFEFSAPNFSPQVRFYLVSADHLHSEELPPNVYLSPLLPEIEDLTGNEDDVLHTRRLVLSWKDVPKDLDAHLIWHDDDSSADRHVYYGKKQYRGVDEGAWLEADAVGSYGHETITIEWMHGTTYRYFVHNNSKEAPLAGCGAVVSLFDSEGWSGKDIVVPTVGEGVFWHVMDIDGELGAITVINKITEIRPVLGRHDRPLKTNEWPPSQEVNPSADLSLQTVQDAEMDEDAEFLESISSASIGRRKLKFSLDYTVPVNLPLDKRRKDRLELCCKRSLSDLRQLPRGQQPVLPKTMRFVDLRNLLPLPGTEVQVAPVDEDGTKVIPGNTVHHSWLRPKKADKNGTVVMPDFPPGCYQINITCEKMAPLVLFYRVHADGKLKNLAGPIFMCSELSEDKVNSVAFAMARGMVVRASDEAHTAVNEVWVSPRRIVLSWEHMPQDLDAHLLWRDSRYGFNRHVYQGKRHYKGKDESAWLGSDGNKGYGPEVISLEWMHASTYRFFVHAYSTERPLAGCGAKVTIYDAGGWCGHEVTIRSQGLGRFWHVFDMDGESGAVTVFNRVMMEPPEWDGVPAQYAMPVLADKQPEEQRKFKTSQRRKSSLQQERRMRGSPLASPTDGTEPLFPKRASHGMHHDKNGKRARGPSVDSPSCGEESEFKTILDAGRISGVQDDGESSASGSSASSSSEDGTPEIEVPLTCWDRLCCRTRVIAKVFDESMDEGEYDSSKEGGGEQGMVPSPKVTQVQPGVLVGGVSGKSQLSTIPSMYEPSRHHSARAPLLATGAGRGDSKKIVVHVKIPGQSAEGRAPLNTTPSSN